MIHFNAIDLMWMIRKVDILKLDAHILDKIQNIYDHDLFYSRDSDENLVDLIIDKCEVLFLPVEKRNKQIDLFSSAFICSYRFNAQNKMIIRLKPGAALKLQQMQPEKSETPTDVNSLKSDDKANDMLPDPDGNSEKLILENNVHVNNDEEISEPKPNRSSDSNESLNAEESAPSSKRRKVELPLRHVLLSDVKVNTSMEDKSSATHSTLDKKKSTLKSKESKRRGSEESEASFNEGIDNVMMTHDDSLGSKTKTTDQITGETEPMTSIETSDELNFEMMMKDVRDEENYGMQAMESSILPQEEEASNPDVDDDERSFNSASPVSPQAITTSHSNATRVDEETAFQRMCSVMKDQVTARYSSTATLTEDEILSILQQLWADMEADEKEIYFNSETFNSSDHIVQQAQDLQTLELIESEESSASSSDNEDDLQQQEDEDDTDTSSNSSNDDDNQSLPNGSKIQSNMSTLITRSMAAKAQEPFMLARLKSEDLLALRIGFDYQADIPSLVVHDDTSEKESTIASYSLISSPSHFISEDFNEYLSQAIKRAHDVLFSLMRANFDDHIHRIDGTCVVLATPIEMIAMEVFNEW